MANAAVSGWTACIRLWQQWLLQPPTDEEALAFAPNLNQQLDQLATLPRAAWKRLSQDVQVTRQLAALCIQYHQQKAGKSYRDFVFIALACWLQRLDTHTASPNSRLAASVQQQLQESGLLQHMEEIFTEAADCLTAAATAVAGGNATPSSRNSSRRGSISAVSAVVALKHALDAVCHVLIVYHGACRLLWPGHAVCEQPVGHAAVCLILTTLQTCSRLQQLAGREDSPAQIQRLASDPEFEHTCVLTSGQALCFVLDLAAAVNYHSERSSSAEGSLQDASQGTPQPLLPGAARELLRCPALLPCLAAAVLAGVLGVFTGAPREGPASNGDGGALDAVGSASRSIAASSSVSGRQGSERGSGRRRQGRQARSSSQQAAAAAAGSSAGRNQAGSSSSPTSSTSSSGRLANGVSLDSLTPLSRSVFSLLGVEQGLLLQAGKGFAMSLWVPTDVRPDQLDLLINAYSFVLEHQVEQLYTPYGATNDELLRHVETDMLMGLAVHQLTASIPDSYPRAHEVRELACKLKCSGLVSAACKTSLHQLPLSAAYTGPQLALQVMLTPLGPPAPLPLLHDQQPQQQQQSQYFIVTPSAQLLTELLPLLTSYCLARVQQQRQQQQLLQEALHRQQLQLADVVQESSAGAAADAFSTLKAVAGLVCPIDVQQCIVYMQGLLRSAVVPDPNLTAEEVHTAAATDSALKAVLQDGDAMISEGMFYTYICALHNAGTVEQHAGEVMRMLEVLLRAAAAVCETAAWVHDNRAVAEVAAAAAGGGEVSGEQLIASCIANAEDSLMWLVEAVGELILHQVHGDFPHQPSALVLAALSAGPGSDLQRRLYSLLCCMVKLGSSPAHAAAAPHVSDHTSAEGRERFVGAAASTAAALVAGSVDGSSHTAAACVLPSLFIVGRCCMWWAQPRYSGADTESFLHELAEHPNEPFPAEGVLAPVQQWLQASSTQEQLVAAGYAPQALPQQLQQAVEALQAARDSAAGDTACLLEAVQQKLLATGSALCSFAVPCLCNNPACSNMSGLSDVGLVSGRSCICGGCRVARYCGRTCQRAVWKQHKPACAALAAAAAAAASAPAGGATVPLLPQALDP